MLKNLKYMRESGGGHFSDFVSVLNAITAYFLAIFLFFSLLFGAFYSIGSFSFIEHEVLDLKTPQDFIEYSKGTKLEPFSESLLITNNNMEIGQENSQWSLSTHFYFTSLTFFSVIIFLLAFTFILNLLSEISALIFIKAFNPELSFHKNKLNSFKNIFLFAGGITYGFYLLVGKQTDSLLILSFLLLVLFLIVILVQIYKSSPTKKTFQFMFAMNSFLVIAFLVLVWLFSWNTDNVVKALVFLSSYFFQSNEVMPLVVLESLEVNLYSYISEYVIKVLVLIGTVGIILISFVQVLQVVVFRTNSFGFKDGVLFILILLSFDVFAFGLLYLNDMLDYFTWIFVLNGVLSILLQHFESSKAPDNLKVLLLTLLLLLANFGIGVSLSSFLSDIGFASLVTLLSQAITIQLTQGINAIADHYLVRIVKAE